MEELDLCYTQHGVCKLTGLYFLEPLEENDSSIGKVLQELAQHKTHLRLLKATVLQECRTRMEQLGLQDYNLEMYIL